MTRIWGISALSHDAALAVVADDEILFAAHSERYSRCKNDPFLHPDLIAAALAYGPPDVIAWYERPLLKKMRHLRAGQWVHAVARADLPRRYLRSVLPFPLPTVTYVGHHDSHAAAAFFTSSFSDAAVIVADSIGEFRTFTIGRYSAGRGLQTLRRLSYPHSLGLLYSAFTRRCGFRPNEDEYIVMGLSALGDPIFAADIYEQLLERRAPTYRLRLNPHRGIAGWKPSARPEDLAASVQRVTEEVLLIATRWAADHVGSRNLVYAGGVALNCVANSRIAASRAFERIYIFPNPGDAGSSLGAAAAVAGRALRWTGPYLGTDIPSDYPVGTALDGLLRHGMVGVANGRAEFGPRALGNRSLLADPRSEAMQDRLNDVKGREPFRPFAPVVRLERAREVFDLPVVESPYMQYTATCREPTLCPAAVHDDGTSRVQTVTAAQHPGLYELLLAWEAETSCPILINTSLNVRGEPLVDTPDDAERFARATGVTVVS